MTIIDDFTQTITTPCPPWCTLAAGHPVDSERGGRECRDHAGPNFGAYISAGAWEYADAPGLLEYSVLVVHDGGTMTVAELIAHARHALEAAEWLGARA